MRAFRCVPISLLFSPVMAELSSFQRDFVFSALVAQDDWHCLPYDAPTLRSVIFPTRPFVALKEIAAARDRLVALGVLIRKANERKEWVEIASGYRHSSGQNETSYGEAAAQPEQKQMSLGPILVEQAAPRAARAASFPRAAKKQPVERRAEKKRSDDSSAGTDSVALDSGIRAKSRGVSPEAQMSGNFAVSSEASDDPVWEDLCRFLNPSNGLMCEELWKNGRRWLNCLKSDRVALGKAVRECMELGKSQTINNRGAALSESFDRARKVAS